MPRESATVGVTTPEFKKIGLSEPIPDGWERANVDLVREHFDAVKPILTEWCIALLIDDSNDHWKVTGGGYGHDIGAVSDTDLTLIDEQVITPTVPVGPDRGVVPEPEAEEPVAAAATAAATEAPDESAVVAAPVKIAGHYVAADTPTLDVSEWVPTAAQVQEIAGALPQLRLRQLVLDGVPVSGSTPKQGDFQYGVETLDADLDIIRTLCKGLRACQVLTSLSLKGCHMGPQALVLLAAAEVFRDASAALNRLTIDSTGVMEDKYGNSEQKTYTLTASDVTIDLSQKNLGPADVTLLTVWIQRPDVSAVVKKVALSGNALTGGEPSYNVTTKAFDIQTDGKDISGVSVLFPSMTKVTELDVSNCGLGATSMPGLAKLVSDATAALASVNFSGNGLTGASKEHGQWENIDLDLSGFVSLCTVLGKVTEVNLNDCGLGSASMPELAKIFSDPSAAVAHLNIAGELISPSVLYTRLPTILALLLTNCLITH
jgi:hypothetical protein